MNVCGVTFGGYLAKILSFKTGNLLNNSKFHLLSEGTVPCCSDPLGKLVIGSARSGSQIPGSGIRNPDPDPWIRPLDLNAF